MFEPLDFGHSRRHTFSKGSNMALKVDKKGVQTPPINDLDGMFGKSCQVESRGTT